MQPISLLICLLLLTWIDHVEVVVKTILKSNLIEVLTHLFTPIVTDTFCKSWQLTALGKLRHEFFTVLPLLERLNLLDLACLSVLANVEESRSIAYLSEERYLVLLLQLEEWHL